METGSHIAFSAAPCDDPDGNAVDYDLYIPDIDELL